MSITKFLSTHKQDEKVTYSQITDNIVFLAFSSTHIYTYIYLHFLHYSGFCFKKAGGILLGSPAACSPGFLSPGFQENQGLHKPVCEHSSYTSFGHKRGSLLMHICPKASCGEHQICPSLESRNWQFSSRPPIASPHHIAHAARYIS